MNKCKISHFIITIIIAMIVASCNPSTNQSLDEIKTEIAKVMDAQEASWNNGNMEEYMQGYWKSDSLKFLSNNRLTFGWEQQLTNYKKGYPDQSTMGKLKFELISVEILGDNTALVIGTYNLERKEMEDAFGYYSLIWKYTNGKWVIVFDHTS